MTAFAAVPQSLYTVVPGLTSAQCRPLAYQAQALARLNAPKLTGASARRIYAVWGEGWFGLRWADSRVWFQERGTAPFTMTKLAGKTIPMWIDDPTGKERSANPKAKVRTTASGKTQILIFRRAAKLGARKMVVRRGQEVDVPASYPGAPGRIAHREVGHPHTRPGKLGGAIARPHTGVRWRHPGLDGRYFVYHAIDQVALGVSAHHEIFTGRPGVGRPAPLERAA